MKSLLMFSKCFDKKIYWLGSMIPLWFLSNLIKALTGFNDVENACFSDIENSENVISLETGSTSGIHSRPSPEFFLT